MINLTRITHIMPHVVRSGLPMSARACGSRAGDDEGAKMLGHRHPFNPTPWDDLVAPYAALADENHDYRNMAAIVSSVVAGGATDKLAASTSHDDLLVVPLPIQEVPYDLVSVRTTDSARVVIEHVCVTGRNDRIERDVSEGVPLFWRFMIEKFGLAGPELERG
jgi:hypothetical protein